MEKYPKLVICQKCKRHGIILISEQNSSTGFMTKQTGFSIIKACYEEQLISEEQYQRLYQEISHSSLLQNDESLRQEDWIILLRLIWMHAETKKGFRFSAGYEPCEKQEPIKLSKTLNQISEEQRA